LEKKYDSPWAGKFKHVIEPTIFYRRIHGVDNLSEIIRFDDQDAIADTNEVAAGIVNRIFRSRETAAGVSQDYEFLSLSLMQKYYFDPTFGGAFRQGESNDFYPLNTLTGFSALGIRRNIAPTNIVLRLSPASGISYDIRADLDSQLQRMRDASLSMYWHTEGLFAGGTYFRTQAVEPGTFESHQVQGQLGYGSPLRGFSASVSLSYNILSEKLLNSHSRINYMWDCCGLALEFQQFNLGSRTESRINFSFTLKGLGSFGNIKRPESLF
jgi:LPS-assembly protein